MHDHWMDGRERGEGRRRGRGPGRGRGRGPGRWHHEHRTTAAERERTEAWFAGRLAGGLIPGTDPSSPPAVSVDDDEILVVLDLPGVPLPGDPDATKQATAEQARIDGFRADTRDRRIQVAQEAEAELGRTVSWGARCGGTTSLFTTTAVPVMTRLRMPERAVLDTLIDGGVARSRSDALAWCVRLVAEHEEQWFADLRSAFEQVAAVRDRGPRPGAG